MTTTAKNTEPGKNAAPPVMELGGDLSPALHAIEKAYRMIQARYAETELPVPDATIVIKRDAAAWGHTTVAKTWAANKGTETAEADRFEIMISGENLRRGAVAVASTLIHETAHARNLNAGVLDTDSNGRHSRKFADLAESMGLKISQLGWHGWTGTEFPEEGQAMWKRLIRTIELGLRKSAAAAQPNLGHLGVSTPTATPAGPEAGPTRGPGRRGTPTGPRKRGNRNLLVASCECGYKIRLSRGVLDAAEPTCSKCSKRFVEVVSDGEAAA